MQVRDGCADIALLTLQLLGLSPLLLVLLLLRQVATWSVAAGSTTAATVSSTCPMGLAYKKPHVCDLAQDIG